MNMVKCALNSVSNYSKNGYLSFDDITVEWLNSYQRNMVDKGNSKSTVGMYLRCVRVVFNKAIKDGVITIDQYPFGKGKYEIPAGRNIKKALKAEDLKKIKEYKPVPDSMEEWARDMWYFIFLCNGINPKDMAKLKYKHIDADQITFVRSTTKDTSKLQMPILIANSERIQNIIAKWGNPDTNAENYVFPILRPGLSPEQIHSRVHDFFSKVNKGMKAIAASLNITDKVTTYVARHSYATVLKHNGISVDYISESMGHSNIRTTERYLASFDLETRRECSRILLDL